MKELSLHILDIAENSISAGASLIKIYINENIKDNILKIIVDDNGCGMTEEFLTKVKKPFFTTKNNRSGGMGIPLLDSAAKLCGGNLDIISEKGIGTRVSASFVLNHSDRVPIGNMPETIQTLICASPDIDFIYTHEKNNNIFCFKTSEIRKELNGLPINIPNVLVWIKEYITDGLSEL